VTPISRTDSLKRIFDFDVETVAAGFADPQWVPQKITCVAGSWIGSDLVESRICGPEGLFGHPEVRAEMLQWLLDRIREADIVTGHNINRFDLPVINSECMRLGLEPIRKVKTEDTMLLVRSKGFKKGLDNLGVLFRTPAQKVSLSWQEWQQAYDEPGWVTVRQRCEGDVLLHKQVRIGLRQERLLRAPRVWSG
jgi:DNA polymerase family B, exonuclease domain